MPQERHHGLEHRQAHVLAAAAALAGEQCGGDRLRRGERRDRPATQVNAVTVATDTARPVDGDVTNL